MVEILNVCNSKKFLHNFLYKQNWLIIYSSISRKILDYIYFKNATKKVKPGQASHMCLEELQQIVAFSGISEFEWFGSTICL